MQESQLWDCSQLVGSKMVYVVGGYQFSQVDSVLCWGRSGFLIVDLTFHVQSHIFGVWCQPPCSSRFACLGSHRSLANCIGFTFEVIVARCGNC